MQRTFDYFASTADSERIGKIILSGGCAQLPGLTEYLAATWGIPVETAQPFSRIDAGSYADRVAAAGASEGRFELERVPDLPNEIRDCCGVLDTLALARRLHPGQRNSLDALAKRYNVDNSKRELHGALLDAQILADIYLAMTGGQASLSLETDEPGGVAAVGAAEIQLDRRGLSLAVPRATPDEERAHEAMLAVMAKRAEPIWRALARERDAAAETAARKPAAA